MSAPDWRQGPVDPLERWIEVRGYWRERARLAEGADEIEQCRRQFDFAGEMLAKARQDATGAARLLALESVAKAIGTRRLSNSGTIAARSDAALGVFGDPRLMVKIDAELRGPLAAMLGNLPALFKALLFGDDVSAVLAQTEAASADMREALNSISAAGDAVRQKRRHRSKSQEGGKTTAAARTSQWDQLAARICAEYDRDPTQQNKAIALSVQCQPSQVTKALRARGIVRRGTYSPRGAR